MGCCNKELTGRPIGRLRYLAGAGVIIAVHGGVFALLSAGAYLSPRCRRVLPFYRAYTRATISGILKRERILLAGERAPNPDCELPK